MGSDYIKYKQRPFKKDSEFTYRSITAHFGDDVELILMLSNGKMKKPNKKNKEEDGFGEEPNEENTIEPEG
jgi:hypothetical protein